ncbi:MAG: serine/threonine-protein kinase [Kiritimatiellae bacterium]|nr:serine/threonine-protein kinase [Kiritimatiellia bacterium]MDD5522535.1 serine/threonine-protein kinase [Kiritimatiellia bacterium]
MSDQQSLNRKTQTINLMDVEWPQMPVPRLVHTVHVPHPVSDSAMTMEQLKRNYESILKKRKIFFPVTYHILREIGSGRQGTVLYAIRYGARDCITEHAIKLFDPRIYRNVEEYWTDMGRIAHQISQFHHLQSPNLVSTDNYEETDGIGYIQMEVIDGLDLRQLMTMENLEAARKRSTSKEWERFSTTIFHFEGGRICLQPGVAVHILRAVLRGLERVHALNFLHSDIKPTNIMIDKLGDVKLVDFGRAVTIGEKVTFLLGSPIYMAPEIHRREPGTAQSDYYSLGLVAIEILSGRRIIEKETFTEDELLRIKIDLPNRLSEILPPYVQANRTLMFILQKFLSPDPAIRYSSAREAEAGEEGLKVISKQLVQANLDAEYNRDLSDFVLKFVDIHEQKTDACMPTVPTSVLSRVG